MSLQESVVLAFEGLVQPEGRGRLLHRLRAAHSAVLSCCQPAAV